MHIIQLTQEQLDSIMPCRYCKTKEIQCVFFENVGYYIQCVAEPKKIMTKNYTTKKPQQTLKYCPYDKFQFLGTSVQDAIDAWNKVQSHGYKDEDL